MQEWRITEETELPAIVVNVLSKITAQTSDGATVLALKGDLGAGKTTFTQYFGRELGVSEVITSPTFVVMKTYELQHDQFTTLVHIDAYRLESAAELEVLRVGELLQQPATLIVIEWPERVQDILPEHTHQLSLEITENGRNFTLS